MDPGGSDKDQLGPKELAGRISESLLVLFRTLSSANSDISIYLLRYAIEDIRRDPYAWAKLDEAYTIYEEQANHCRRSWMKLRATAEKDVPKTITAVGTSPAPEFRSQGRSPSPLEYQSDHGEHELDKIDQVTVMDVDPPPPNPKPKKNDTPTSQRVIVTPSGPTSCRLAPIPKGVKLSVELNRDPNPKKALKFWIPQELPIDAKPERGPLNRTKRSRPDTFSSQTSFSSLKSTSQNTGPSTAQTSVSASPKRNYSSSKDYWYPRRPIRPNDFQMEDNRLFGSLDCLGPPFHVEMDRVTHNGIPTTWQDLATIYGGKIGLTPKISSKKLETHGFDHWMTPNVEFHPSLPAQPGWPGLMLRLDDGLEEWRPEEGVEFRVVVRKDQQFLEYIGQYEMVRLDDVTADEWQRQPAKVKKRWMYILGGGQTWQEVVASVSLRKTLAREPTTQEFKKYTEKLHPDTYTVLAKELEADIDQSFCEEEEIIAVWGMKCVGYDYKFEKHLAGSLKGVKPSSSGSSKKPKSAVKVVDSNHDGEDDGKEDEPECHDSPPPKRQRVARGKSKPIRYDWSDSRYPDDSKDQDYQPA